MIENCVTTLEFIEFLAGSQSAGIGVSEEYLESARKLGWLEEYDVLHKDEPILRKNAARILHMYMRTVLNEPDEKEPGPAWKLRDIYDCRVCAAHIAEVVDKGIMIPFFYDKDFGVFESDRTMDKKEAEECIERMRHPGLRAVALFR